MILFHTLNGLCPLDDKTQNSSFLPSWDYLSVGFQRSVAYYVRHQHFISRPVPETFGLLARLNGTNMRLTDGLAIYGASLSTATAVWNYFRTRSQVRVILIYALETIQGESQHGVGISIQNISTQTVHISNVSFLYPYRKSTFRDKVEHLVRFKRIPRNDGWCHSGLSLH